MYCNTLYYCTTVGIVFFLGGKQALTLEPFPVGPTLHQCTADTLYYYTTVGIVYHFVFKEKIPVHYTNVLQIHYITTLLPISFFFEKIVPTSPCGSRAGACNETNTNSDYYNSNI